jgi:hypothetical protein
MSSQDHLTITDATFSMTFDDFVDCLPRTLTFHARVNGRKATDDAGQWQGGEPLRR